MAAQLDQPAAVRIPDKDGLLAWAERTGRRQALAPGGGRLRFAFYGRVSTEYWQDPVTSRARQLGQAGALVAGHGQIVWGSRSRPPVLTLASRRSVRIR